MSKGVPTPMENVPPDQTRDHAWHWGTVLDGSARGKRRSRFGPPVGDLVLATVTGFLLGSSIVYVAMRDGFPVMAVFAVMFLIVHAMTLGIAHIGDETRPTREEYLRITSAYGVAGLIGALVTLAFLI